MAPNSGNPPVLSIVGTAGATVDVGNFSGVLPPPSEVKDRNAFVRAATASGLGLDGNALHAIARGVIDPGAAATTVKNDLLTTEVVGPVNIRMLTANVWLTELFPLMQPRAGGFAHSVHPPIVQGSLDDDGDPLVELEIEFEDVDHLREFMIETVTLTKAHGRDYSNSILAKRVSRAGLAHVARISFTDGTESFVVLCVRDGITRVVSSWAAQNPTLAPTELGEFIADRLLTRRLRPTGANESMARARGREAVAADMRGRFIAGIADETPTEDAVRIGQTFTLPMQICVGMRQWGSSPVAASLVFDDTMQAVIASVHGEFRPWEPAATQTATILRAIPRAVHADRLGPRVAELAVGTKGVKDMKAVFGKHAPEDELWRAVFLMSYLTHWAEWDGIKRQMRELSGASQVSRLSYVSHMATLIDLPWQRVKVNTERQSRRAWANGGPVPRSMLGTNWDAVPTDDFLTLVDDAVNGDVNAKNTLIIAGGIALITDKLLMANVGSALTSGQVPFRADVDVVVEGLADTEYGLCLLAHAANAFDAKRIARNSYTSKELAANPKLATNTYVVPAPDPDNPRLPARDGNDNLLPLTVYEVVRASNPTRAQEETTPKAPPAKESASARAHRLRSTLLRDLESAVAVSDDLVATVTGDGAVAGGAFGDRSTYESVDALVRKLQLFVLSSAATVPKDSSDGGVFVDLNDEDEDDDLDDVDVDDDLDDEDDERVEA